MQQLKSNNYSTKPATKVCMPWSRQDLNEFCAWAEEQFGLPGDRFQWVSEKLHMEFYFKDERDAEWFILRWI